MERIYFDANAGAPLLGEAKAAMLSALEAGANASSVHAEGRRARAIVERARAAVAAAVGARTQNVIFTSGASEAAAHALSPAILAGRNGISAGRLYVGATEHPAVMAGGRFEPERLTTLPVDASGVIELAELERALDRHDPAEGVPYVALMLANNESGVIHPVTEAARLVKERGGFVYCDAAQALGRIPVDIAELGVDFLGLSAHKAGGPQGAGALVLASEDIRPKPLVPGGGQERRQRSGTENVAAIAGFGVAAEHANDHLEGADRLASLRVALEAGLRRISPDVVIAGEDAPRLPNTVLFAAPGVAAEVAIIAFDLAGIAVSAGSACSSGKVQPSHVLAAMGAGPELSRGGIRVSLMPSVQANEIEAFLDAWRGIHARLTQSRAA